MSHTCRGFERGFEFMLFHLHVGSSQ
jgi:hypothetical protein